MLQNNNRFNETNWIEQLFRKTQAIEDHLSVLEGTLMTIAERFEQQGFDKELYTVGEVATRAGKSSYTIRVHYINAGKLEARKTESGRWLIHKDELRRLLQNEL